MGISRAAWDFNKELVLGEIGALIGTPLVSLITSLLTTNDTAIALAAAIGGQVVGAIFWVTTHVFDRKRNKRFTMRNLKEDIIGFTPVAMTMDFIIYEPLLFFVSRHFLQGGGGVLPSVIGAQALAYTCFLSGMNLYRLGYNKYAKKKLFE